MDIDDLTCKILNVGSPGCALTKMVKEADILQLCDITRGVFLSQSSLIEVNPPIKICGDIHGQYAGKFQVYLQIYLSLIYFQILCAYLIAVAFLLVPTICSLETMLIEDDKIWKLFACYFASRLVLKLFLSWDDNFYLFR